VPAATELPGSIAVSGGGRRQAGGGAEIVRLRPMVLLGAALGNQTQGRTRAARCRAEPCAEARCHGRIGPGRDGFPGTVRHPQRLAHLSGEDHNVVLVGMDACIEVWSPGYW
jgi:hypothetical protein